MAVTKWSKALGQLGVSAFTVLVGNLIFLGLSLFRTLSRPWDWLLLLNKYPLQNKKLADNPGDCELNLSSIWKSFIFFNLAEKSFITTGIQLGKMGTCGRNTTWRSTSKETKLPSLSVHDYVGRTLFWVFNNLHTLLKPPLHTHFPVLPSGPPFPDLEIFVFKTTISSSSLEKLTCVFSICVACTNIIRNSWVCPELRPDLLTQNLSWRKD